MDSCEEMKIQDWDAALYKKGESAYLCWTYSPEVTYVLEYNPEQLDDSEIIKMAESAEVMEWFKSLKCKKEATAETPHGATAVASLSY